MYPSNAAVFLLLMASDRFSFSFSVTATVGEQTGVFAPGEAIAWAAWSCLARLSTCAWSVLVWVASCVCWFWQSNSAQAKYPPAARRMIMQTTRNNESLRVVRDLAGTFFSFCGVGCDISII